MGLEKQVAANYTIRFRYPEKAMVSEKQVATNYTICLRYPEKAMVSGKQVAAKLYHPLPVSGKGDGE